MGAGASWHLTTTRPMTFKLPDGDQQIGACQL